MRNNDLGYTKLIGMQKSPSTKALPVLSDADITLRAETCGDREFLIRLYASTRQAEMALVPWMPEQKEAFIRMQFEAQRRDYLLNYKAASFQIVVVNREITGRLYLDRRPNEIRIVDITLLPEWRGRGIGSYLLGKVLTEGQRRRLPVSIHVERSNPALTLYRRLGFQKVSAYGIYWLMVWKPVREDPCSIN
jgi:ribosomal protein S18 acetylase RimI-like enzyme